MLTVAGYEDVSCLLCQSQKRHLKYEKVHMGRPIFVQQCDDCGFLYFSPRPTRAMFQEIYAHEYFKNFIPDFSQEFHFQAKYLAEGFRLKKISELCPRGADSLVEIGCGFGYQLLAAQDHFKNVIGVELNHEAAQHTRSLGFTVLETPAEDCDIPTGSVDVVVMYTVIEHLLDPMKVLQKIHSWLKPNGLLVVQTCNANSLNLKWQGVNSNMICIDHVSFFSDRTLKQALRQSGFHLEDMMYNRGLSAAEERQYCEIQQVAPLKKTNPAAARKLSCKLDWLCRLRALNFLGVTWNISITAFCRKGM